MCVNSLDKNLCVDKGIQKELVLCENIYNGALALTLARSWFWFLHITASKNNSVRASENSGPTNTLWNISSITSDWNWSRTFKVSAKIHGYVLSIYGAIYRWPLRCIYIHWNLDWRIWLVSKEFLGQNVHMLNLIRNNVNRINSCQNPHTT